MFLFNFEIDYRDENRGQCTSLIDHAGVGQATDIVQQEHNRNENLKYSRQARFADKKADDGQYGCAYGQEIEYILPGQYACKDAKSHEEYQPEVTPSPAMLTIEKDYLSCYRYSASGGARPGGNQSVMQRPDDVADQFDGQQLLAIFLPKYNRIDNDSDYAEATRYYPRIIHLSLF